MQVDVHEQLAPLEREWDELADRVGASPFLRPGWLTAWWNSFGAGRLQIVTVREGGDLVGVLPTYRCGSVITSTTNWHTPTFGVLATTSLVAAALLRATFQRPERRTTLSFLDPANLSMDDLLQAARAARRQTIVRPIQRSPYVTIEDSWNSYEVRLGKNVRNDIRRRRRRLEASGEVTVEVANGVAGLPELLNEGFRIEASGWKASQGTAITSSPTTIRFYTEIARWSARRGWLRLAFLRVDGRPVAFQYGIETENAYYYLKGGYDVGYREFSPGKLLHHSMIERAFTIGSSRYEFLGASDPYKLQWADSEHELLVLHAFRQSGLGRLDWATTLYGGQLARGALSLVKRMRSARQRAGRGAV